ncbi:MAG TPA: hypothetical protein VFW96_08775 [Thermomicrobiales bacterium]|nr:hypothetical protein [Thermomicrobiales bacterium]
MMARATRKRERERAGDRPTSEEDRKAVSYAEYTRGVPEPVDRVEVTLRRLDYLFWRLRRWVRGAK